MASRRVRVVVNWLGELRAKALVPGPATYQLDLFSGTTVIDSKTVAVKLR